MKFIKDKYSSFFYLFYFLLIVALLIMNLYRFSLVNSVGLILAIGLFIFRKKINISKHWFIILLIIPIILRFGLLFLSYGNLASDYEFFYGSAVSYSNGLPLASDYLSLFPYLYLYIVVLGSAFKLISTKYFVVVLVNIVVELIGVIFLYKTVKDKPFGKNLVLLYLFNPFSIMWLIKCCPVTFVNALLMIVFYLFTKIDLKGKYLLFSLLTGIFMGLANNFRPVLIVFLIAIFIYYLYLLINKYPLKNVIISFIVIAISFISVNKLILLYTENNLGVELSGNESGWSVFVGSNYESGGRWNIEDSNFFDDLVNEKGGKEAHKEVFSLAIERYKSYGIKNVMFVAKKGAALGSNLTSYTYEDVTYSILNVIPTWMSFIIKAYLYFYMILILLLNFVSSYKLLKNKDTLDEYGMFGVFGFGLFASMLLVEVHARYFMPILIPIIYMACYNKDDVLENK